MHNAPECAIIGVMNEEKKGGTSMEFLIASDSHGRAGKLQEALERQLRTPEALFFLGDGLRDLASLSLAPERIVAVRGNCDLFSAGSLDTPEERLLAYGEHRILLCHGHTHGVKGGLGALLAHAARRGADVVLYGHTHRAQEQVIPAGTLLGGVLLESPLYAFNPGSIAEGSFGTLLLGKEGVLLSHGSL